MQQQTVPTTMPLGQLRGTESVLAVDDSHELRALIGQQMRSLGYRVTLAASGDEALTILEEDAGRFDILVSDIMMPGKLDGLALARMARVRWPELRVLLVSGYAGTGALEDEAAAFPLLRKPYRKMQLAQSVRLALAGRGAGQMND
jgi:CheY-like chemotaxis protein